MLLTADGTEFTGDPLVPRTHPRRFDVRATRIDLQHVWERQAGLRAELWVGGGDTALGEPVGVADVAGAWVVDCAGELPQDLMAAAGRWIPRVFEDLEQEPPHYDRVRLLSRQLAGSLAGDDPPARLYVMCKQGFNRSGLVAGRILRELGLRPSVAIELLESHRPGALSNAAFRRLVEE